MPTESAGLLLYRKGAKGLEVLLVHPGGPFFRNKDLGAWSIPKGEVQPGEEPLGTAFREFEEELGPAPSGPFHPLAPVRQRGGKIVRAWACRGNFDVAQIRGGTFSLEWPPRSGRMQEFPEVDRAEFFEISAAAEKINTAQQAFLTQLAALSLSKAL